jgi:hypothetical protein
MVWRFSAAQFAFMAVTLPYKAKPSTGNSNPARMHQIPYFAKYGIHCDAVKMKQAGVE